MRLEYLFLQAGCLQGNRPLERERLGKQLDGGDWYYQYLVFPDGETHVSIDSLWMDRDGKLFASGEFKVAGGKSADYIAVWNGQKSDRTWNGCRSVMKISLRRRQMETADCSLGDGLPAPVEI